MPRLCSVYLWTSAWAREDVVPDDIQGYTSEFLVEEAVNTKFKGLYGNQNGFKVSYAFRYNLQER